MMTRVSVVLPTYNRAKDLHRILDSLLSQTYREIELIVVNDGSKDDTEKVLAEYSRRDARVIPVNKTNGGPSAARNAGIKVAKGEFIFFIDDDDDVPNDYIESFMKKEYDEVDLLIDSYSNQTDDQMPVPVHFPKRTFVSPKEVVDFMVGTMPDSPYCFFAYGKRFRRAIIEQNDLHFSEIISIGEDRPFVIDFILSAGVFRIIDNSKYIVKCSSSSEYRLSKGHKPLDWLWFNIRSSFEYLMSVGSSLNSEKVFQYANNYLATRLMDYIFIPFALDKVKEDKDWAIVEESVDFLRNNVNLRFIGRREAKLFSKALTKFNIRPVIALLIFRLKASALIKR